MPYKCGWVIGPREKHACQAFVLSENSNCNSVLQPSRYKQFQLFHKDKTRKPNKLKVLPLAWKGKEASLVSPKNPKDLPCGPRINQKAPHGVVDRKLSLVFLFLDLLLQPVRCIFNQPCLNSPPHAGVQRPNFGRLVVVGCIWIDCLQNVDLVLLY